MAELTKTQTRILTIGAQRPGYLAMPLPKGLHGAAAQKVADMLIGRGFLEEVDADIRKGEPFWRETGDGHGTTLVVTEAGLAAIGVEPLGEQTKKPLRKAEKTSKSAIAPKTPRTGTKQAQLITMLQTRDGASINEMAAATGWQAHTIRGAISGALKKKLGLDVSSEKTDGRGRIYRILS
ncbi:DUF3489 domain-containing protein [Rhodobacteraceae bacterium M382]|nr:DUF3489 domain-containing protein [Rhodobacteraceae bacterium M382]